MMVIAMAEWFMRADIRMIQNRLFKIILESVSEIINKTC